MGKLFHYCTEFEIIIAFLKLCVQWMILIAHVGVLLGKRLASPLEQLTGEDKITKMWDLGVWFSHETCCIAPAVSTGRLESRLKYFTPFPVLV